MDKKFLVAIAIGLLLVLFKDRINEHLGKLNTIQKLMIGQVIILLGALIALLYYVFAPSKE